MTGRNVGCCFNVGGNQEVNFLKERRLGNPNWKESFAATHVLQDKLKPSSIPIDEEIFLQILVPRI